MQFAFLMDGWTHTVPYGKMLAKIAILQEQPKLVLIISRNFPQGVSQFCCWRWSIIWSLLWFSLVSPMTVILPKCCWLQKKRIHISICLIFPIICKGILFEKLVHFVTYTNVICSLFLGCQLKRTILYWTAQQSGPLYDILCNLHYYWSQFPVSDYTLGVRGSLWGCWGNLGLGITLWTSFPIFFYSEWFILIVLFCWRIKKGNIIYSSCSQKVET